MSHTLTMNPDGPNEISWRHSLPVWAIPQLSFLKKRLGIIITSVTREPETQSLVVKAFLPNDAAYYLFRIHKAHMNNPEFIPPMYEV